MVSAVVNSRHGRIGKMIQLCVQKFSFNMFFINNLQRTSRCKGGIVCSLKLWNLCFVLLLMGEQEWNLATFYCDMNLHYQQPVLTKKSRIINGTDFLILPKLVGSSSLSHRVGRYTAFIWGIYFHVGRRKSCLEACFSRFQGSVGVRGGFAI